MNLDEIRLDLILEASWKRFSVFCGLETLSSLRRTCKRMHAIVGTCFVPLEHVHLFPTVDCSADEVLKGAKVIELFREGAELFSSIPAPLWEFWCVQSRISVEHAMQRLNARTLHLTTSHPFTQEDFLEFTQVREISADFQTAFARLEAHAYAGVTSIALLPVKENLIESYLQRITRFADLKLVTDQTEEGEQPMDENAFQQHFQHLLINGFSDVTHFSMFCRTWPEVEGILNALTERQKLPEPLFARLTTLALHLPPPLHPANRSAMISAATSPAGNFQNSSGFAVPQDVGLIPALLNLIPSLEDLWIDHGIPTIVGEVETLDLKRLKRLHATLAGDPPVCLTLSGTSLKYLRLQVHDGSVVTLDPATTKWLEKIEIAASLQAIAFLLNGLESGINESFTKLHTIEFSASMSLATTMPVFELVDIPSLTRLHARFSLSPASTLQPPGPGISSLPMTMNRMPSILPSAPMGTSELGMPSTAQVHQHHAHELVQPLELSINLSGSALRHLTLDARPGVLVQALSLNPAMLHLHTLRISSHPFPRASSVLYVTIPYLPPSITNLHIPAQWTLRTSSTAISLPKSNEMHISTSFNATTVDDGTGVTEIRTETSSNGAKRGENSESSSGNSNTMDISSGDFEGSDRNSGEHVSEKNQTLHMMGSEENCVDSPLQEMEQQWINFPIKLDCVSSKLSLSTFCCLQDASSILDLNPRLTTLSLQILVPNPFFLPLFASVLPQLVNLRECLLRIISTDELPCITTTLSATAIRSNSLQMLNLKMLPQVYTKPTPHNTVGATQRIAPNCATAIDPHIVFPAFPGRLAEAAGRSNCNMPGCICSGYTRDSSALALHRPPSVWPSCATIGCGHAAKDHREASDSSSRWLNVEIHCPNLTHLALGGLSNQTDISNLLRSSRRLTHAQISFADTHHHLTIAHPTLTTLHLARVETATTLFLNLPSLVRLYVEHCPTITSIWPMPTPKLETIHSISSASLTPDSRLAISRSNKKGPTLFLVSPPSKHLFPDFIPYL